MFETFFLKNSLFVTFSASQSLVKSSLSLSVNRIVKVVVNSGAFLDIFFDLNVTHLI